MEAFLFGISKEDSKMNEDQLIGLVLEPKERDGFAALCKRYGIPLLYPRLFKGKPHHLWGISKRGVGLLGTEIMRRLPKICHGLAEAEEYLKNLANS